MFSKVEERYNELYASSTHGNIHVIDVRDCALIQTFYGHSSPINDFIVVGDLIVTAGDDCKCNVFDLNTFNGKALKETEESEKI